MRYIAPLLVLAVLAAGCKIFGSRDKTEEAIAALPSISDGSSRTRSVEVTTSA